MIIKHLQKIHQGWQWVFYMYEEWAFLMKRMENDEYPFSIEMEADEFFHNLNLDYPNFIDTYYL